MFGASSAHCSCCPSCSPHRDAPSTRPRLLELPDVRLCQNRRARPCVRVAPAVQYPNRQHLLAAKQESSANERTMLRGRPSASQTRNLSRQRPQQLLQTPPATTHPRFDRALRALQYPGYFTIRQFVEIGQQQYLAKLLRQSADRVNHLSVHMPTVGQLIRFCCKIKQLNMPLPLGQRLLTPALVPMVQRP